MAVNLQAPVDERIAKYVHRLQEQLHATEAAVVRELIEGGYSEVVRRLHARYRQGEITFRAMAAELGLSLRELYDLCEEKGLSM